MKKTITLLLAALIGFSAAPATALAAGYARVKGAPALIGTVPKIKRYEKPIDTTSPLDDSIPKLSGLRITKTEYNWFDFAWDRDHGYNAGYRLERSEDGQNWIEVSDTDLPRAVTNDTNLKTDKTYYYRARIYSRFGGPGNYSYKFGPYSDIISGTTKLQPPRDFESAGTYEGAARFRWNFPGGATAMELQRSTDNQNFETVLTVTSPTWMGSDKTTKAGTTYYYRIRAVRVDETGTHYSEPSESIKYESQVAAPDSIWLDKVSPKSVTLNWGGAYGADGYILERSQDKSNNYTEVYKGSKSSFTDTPAKAGVYYYRVCAYKTVDGSDVKSAYSEPFGVKTDLTSPTGLKATAEKGKIVLSWDTVKSAMSYNLYRSTTFKDFDLVYRGSKPTFTDTDVKAGTRYMYFVEAVMTYESTIFRSPYSYDVYVTATDASSPSKPGASSSPSKPASGTLAAPKGLKATASGSSAKLSWNAVSGAAGYEVRRSTDNKNFKKIYSGNGKSTTNTNLKPNTKYYYQVLAYKTVNGKRVYGKASASVWVKTAPAAPANVKAQSAKNKVTITWNKAPGASGYEVYRSTNNKTFSKIGTVSKGSVLKFTDTKAKSGVKYYYKVAAYGLNGSKKVVGAKSRTAAVK